jgi:hypothetical protein
MTSSSTGCSNDMSRRNSFILVKELNVKRPMDRSFGKPTELIRSRLKGEKEI